jgi:hypothetical protein
VGVVDGVEPAAMAEVVMVWWYISRENGHELTFAAALSMGQAGLWNRGSAGSPGTVEHWRSGVGRPRMWREWANGPE